MLFFMLCNKPSWQAFQRLMESSWLFFYCLTEKDDVFGDSKVILVSECILPQFIRGYHLFLLWLEGNIH